MAKMLEDKVVLITGAGGGIGREMALLAARHGAKVVVNDLGGAPDGTGDDRTAAEQVVDEIKDLGGEAVANGDNVADWDGGRRLVESAVGAHLANAAASGTCELFYWREQNQEVDFVIRAGRTVLAIEVKSGRAPDAFSGLAAFSEAFKPQRTLLVGADGVALDEFLTKPVEHWLQV